jgi:phosphatidylinositol 3-kinase
MKICREMIDAMGGSGSAGYAAFKTLCCEAYNILRKSANLIISLFVLMADAGIPDIHGEIDATVRRLIDRFRPDLNDEEAVQWIIERINESVTSLAPQVMEKFHQVAQFLRQ